MEWLDPTADVNALCAFAGQDSASYPLLAGIDPYDDTSFNQRQAAVLGLTALLEPVPKRPAHRRLVFIGD